MGYLEIRFQILNSKQNNHLINICIKSSEKHPYLSQLRLLVGSGGWCKMRKYGNQNYAELAMQRYKRIIGNRMHSKDIVRQKNEVIIGASILNKTAIGMPISVLVA